MNELATTTLNQVISAHNRVLSGAARTKEAILETVNAAREAGLHLEGLCKAHGVKLKPLFFGNVTRYNFPFSYETAALYKRFFEANPEPITELKDGVESLKQAFIAAGALSAPKRLKAQSSQETDAAIEFIELLGGLDSLIGKRKVVERFSTMNETELEQYRSQYIPTWEAAKTVAQALGLN